MLIPLGFNRHNRHRFDDAEISSWKGLPGPRDSGPCEHRGACRREEPEPPPVATPSFSVKQTRVPLGSPVEVTYKFVVAKNAPPITENFRVFVHFLDADNERMWTDDHDPADSDDAMEAGADDRIHEDDVRARLSVSGRDDSVDGPLFGRRLNSRLPLARKESTASAPTSSDSSSCCRGPRASS